MLASTLPPLPPGTTTTKKTYVSHTLHFSHTHRRRRRRSSSQHTWLKITPRPNQSPSGSSREEDRSERPSRDGDNARDQWLWESGRAAAPTGSSCAGSTPPTRSQPVRPTTAPLPQPWTRLRPCRTPPGPRPRGTSGPRPRRTRTTPSSMRRQWRRRWRPVGNTKTATAVAIVKTQQWGGLRQLAGGTCPSRPVGEVVVMLHVQLLATG
jgi:hypothetical protein